MDVEISEASLADAEDISTLAIATYVDTFGAEFEPAELAYHLDATIALPRWTEHLARDRVLLAREAGTPIGFVQFGPYEKGGVEIRRLYVLAAWQGQGIGSALLERALAELADAPIISIEVWENNPAARRLYERHGFRHEGDRVPFILESGEIDGYDVVLVLRQG